jgi:CNT family concentrative nucleoside transporter
MIFAYVFAPFGVLLGFTGHEALAAGQLLGTKVAVNELVAYGELVQMPGLSERTINIMTYALCGFSNFSCIGIQVGGIGALVPTKRTWLTQLGLYAVLGGTLTNLLSAMIAGLLL